MGEVFIGREAVLSGRLTRHELQRWYRPIFRGVYVPRNSVSSLRDRTVGAWLASDRKAVIAGVAASALHDAEWVDDDIPIDLISSRARPQNGLAVRDETLGDDEITSVAGLPVTTVARTAFDLGRHLTRGKALARLDALMRAQVFPVEDVVLLAKRHPSQRGLLQLRELLPIVDGGAASPKETWLRLLFIDSGLPIPTTTQIPIFDEGRVLRTIDMGWEDFMVGAEYDGDQHRTNRAQYVKDMRVWRKLELRWKVTRVIKEDRADDIVSHTWEAMVARGWKPPSPRSPS
jgi:hypothetical protein